MCYHDTDEEIRKWSIEQVMIHHHREPISLEKIIEDAKKVEAYVRATN